MTYSLHFAVESFVHLHEPQDSTELRRIVWVSPSWRNKHTFRETSPVLAAIITYYWITDHHHPLLGWLYLSYQLGSGVTITRFGVLAALFTHQLTALSKVDSKRYNE